MKQKLLNSLRLQLCTIVACLLCAFNGQAWGKTVTVSMNSFSAISGNVGNDTNISYEAAKGNASTAPAVNNNQIRVYQNGGTFTITANNGVKINSITLGSAMATTVTYSIDNGTASSNQSISANGAITIGSLDCSSVLFTCTGTDKNSRLYVNSLSVTYTTGGSIPTYSVNFDAGGGTFVGNDDFPSINNTKEAGTYTLPSATREGYTFNGWLAGNSNPITGEYSVTNDIDFTASYTQEGLKELSFDVSSNPGNWPTTNSTTLTNYTYTINGESFSFALKNVKCNNGYLMLTSTAVLGLPAIEGYKLTKVVISNSNSCSTKTYVGISSSDNNASYIYGGDKILWSTTGTQYTYNLNDTDDNTVYYLYVTSANAQITNLALTYEATDATSPRLSVTTPDALAYDATSGSIAYTLTNPVTGTTLIAVVTEGDWLTLGTVGETSIPFTCEANNGEARTATVTLTYGTITKTVTVTQAAAPVTYTTIPEIFAAATEAGSTGTDVNVTFGNWVVTGVGGSNVYVTDNNGNGFIIYKSGHGFVVNDKLSGIVNGTPLKLYNQSAEFTDITTSTEGLNVTHDGTVTVVTDKSIADLGGVNTGAVITISRLTYNGTELSDGTNTIKPYNTLYSGTFENGKIYNVTGIYLQYNSTKELLPRSADDIVEVLEPSIVADNVHIACDATSGEISYTINNPVEGTNLTATEEVEWISNLAVDATNHKVTFTTTANTGAERSGVITLTYGSVTKEVTVSQAVYTITSTYTLATSIVSGKHYVIASAEEDGSAGVINVMAAQKDNNRGATYGTLNGNDLSVSGHAELVIYGPDANGFYSIYDAVEGGYLYAASSSSNYLRTQVNNNDNGLWTISIDETGIATITAQGDKTRNKMRYNSQNSVFSCYGSGQDDIYLYVKDGEETPNESVTVSNAGYATYCSENALDFTNSQIKAFIGTRNGTSLVFNPINKVPANTGILLYKVGGATEQIPVATTVDNATGNCLVGVTEQTTITADDYILSRSSDGVGFYKAGQYTTLGANRAYIPATAVVGVKNFSINFGGDTDAIENLNLNANDNATIYNVAGQRVGKMTKGIYVVNGKKVIVK